MEDKWRKLKIGALALLIVFGVYFLYNRFSETPHIQIEGEPVIRGEIAEVEQLPEEGVKKVGPVGIGQLEMARFSTLDPKTKRLEREFGFEKLLHEEGSQWEIEKPYMNIYRPELTCYVTADKGFVLLESEVNPPTPKDATLIGNVKAHIVPKPGSDIRESFVYLDDLSFFSEKSRFSTAGPIRFVSDNAIVKGRGLELVYDQQNKRLAFLRIEEIQQMELRSSKDYSLTRDKVEEKGTDSTPAQASREKGQMYKCIFGNNVSIETVDEIILANQLSISDILWKDSSVNGSEENITEANIAKESDADANERNFETFADPAVPINRDSAAASIPDDMVEIAVSCDAGIVIVPQQTEDVSRAEKLFSERRKDKWDLDKKAEQSEGRTFFIADQIDYSTLASEAVADGRSILQFYVSDILSDDSDMVTPVTVMSNKRAKFSDKSNHVSFEGNCVCKMVRFEEGMLQEYSLSGDRLLVDLAKQAGSDKRTTAPPNGRRTSIEKITVLSDIRQMARLSSVKKVGKDFITGIELKCPKFEYDTKGRMFTAFGSGVVKVDNSKIPQLGEDVGKFSLQRPCYAIVRDFDKLSYELEREKIIAYNEQGRLYIDYFPIVKHEQQQVSMTAGRIEADLVETVRGHYRLWALTASEGISFEDEDKVFEGSELVYNDRKSIIIAKGSDAMPAYFNGVLFDGIEYDLVTDEVKNIEIRGPGYFQSGN
ncbi:MAG: hypothetical protein JW804_07960 [Sedimentisphaerales bacterium]|nr:hypothetical protein [Sedimentisphaerales bacterium]